MGKGSSQAQTDSTVRQTTLPEYADPYFSRLLQGAEDSTQPYQDDLSNPIYDDAGNITGFGQTSTYIPYQGERIASSDMYGDIMSSRGMVRGIAESGIAGMPEAMGAARKAMGYQDYALQGLADASQYAPGQFQEVGATPYYGFQAGDTGDFAGRFQAGDTGDFAGRFQAADTGDFSDLYRQTGPTSALDEFQAVAPTQFTGYEMAEFSPSGEFDEYQFRPEYEFSDFDVRPDFQYQQFQFDPTRQFSGFEASKYMSPFMEGVVGEQKRGALEDFEQRQSARDAAATQAGAFGGSRQAVAQSLAEEELSEQLGQIEKIGRQDAYAQAAQQFERDRAAQMQQEGRQAAEFGRVQAGQAAEQGRVDALRLQEQSQREMAQADEYARQGNMRAAEASRVQAGRTAELARVQAGMASEMGRVQAGEAAENARMDAMMQQEAARTQAGRVGEIGRMDAMMQQEAARVQDAQARELARAQQLTASEVGRIQQSQVAELARSQGLTLNEAARVQQSQVAELARSQGLTLDEAARVQAAQASENARLDDFLQREQARIQSAYEQSRQFGAGQALSGYQAMGTGAGQYASLGAGLAGLGERQRAADIQGAQLLETIGRDIRSEDQARLDLAYEDFLRQRNYPMSQYERMSSILRGVPVTPNVEEQRFASYNPIQQALGAGISGLGLYKGLTA
jgi:hypothetical protein